MKPRRHVYPRPDTLKWFNINGQSNPLQIVACAHRLSRNALLDLLPNPLAGVEVGCIRGQEEQRDLAAKRGEAFLDLAGLVNAVTIHHQIDLALHACRQAGEEFTEGFRRDGPFMDHEAHLALGTDRGQHLQRESCARARNHRSFAHRRPDVAGVAVRAHARLVGEGDHGVIRLGLPLDRGKFLAPPPCVSTSSPTVPDRFYL